MNIENRKQEISIHFIIVFLLLSFRVMASEPGHNPIAVSPGSDTEMVEIWQSCPTFSWSSVEQAASYRIAVFNTVEPKVITYMDMIATSSPVISKDIPGPALSWTLSSDLGLKTGNMYAWYVQALDASGNALGQWSNGRIFKVEQEVRFAGIEDKLAEKLRTYGVSEETIKNVLTDIKSEVKEVVAPETGDRNTPGTNGIQGFEGVSNTAYGLTAGVAITTGNRNSFFGREAGEYNTTGQANTFIGYASGIRTTTGSWNTFVGADAALYNTLGGANTFIGYEAGFTNTTGHSNTFIGNEAGINNTTGYQNIFIGLQSGRYNSTGNGNIFLGFNAGFNETGSNKLYIANSNTTSPLIYGQFDNKIITINGKLGIGTKTPAYPMELDTTGLNAVIVTKRTDGAASLMSATGSYAQFGSVSNHAVRFLVNNSWKLILNTNGSLSMANGATCTIGGVWTNASSRSLKENIQALSTGEAMDTLNKLIPVKYNYKIDKANKHVGFIAEDVPDLVATADRKGLSPMDITAVLTRVVQEQQEMIREQQQINREYKNIIADLLKRIVKLEKRK